MAMWTASYIEANTSLQKTSTKRQGQSLFLSIFDLNRHDLLMSLACAGCSHLAVKIFRFLDSSSLLAASLVCTEWQQFLLEWFYGHWKFRHVICQRLFEHQSRVPQSSKLIFTLNMARSAIIDVTVDDDLNLFALAILSGRPHVMSTSLFAQGKKRWVHRFSEHFPPASLTCISAGQSLVALGSKDGKIHMYQSSTEYKCLRLIAVLAHHSGAIHTILFTKNRILSGSDDMSVGIVNILPDGSLMLSKLLQGHVSRVRALDYQADQVLSGSDDRSVKLWSLSAGSPSTPVCTLTGHSGPVTGVLLASPLALSAAGSIVRVWDVASKTCLKLLQHSDVPVTAITWISTFRGVATIDSQNILRTFSLENVENLQEEIVVASSKRLIDSTETSNSSPIISGLTNQSLQHYSPKQSLKFYGSRDPRGIVSAWPNNAILKLESIPHHFTAFSIRNDKKGPAITLHCLDYVSF